MEVLVPPVIGNVHLIEQCAMSMPAPKYSPNSGTLPPAPSGWRASGQQIIVLGVLLIGSLILFRALGEFERSLSLLFLHQVPCGDNAAFNPEAEFCGWFPMLEHPAFRGFWKALVWLGGAGVLITALWGFSASLTGRAVRLDRLYVSLLGILSFVAGPIVIVNLLLKSHWGRPRPFQTIDLGRFMTYEKPGTISDQCAINCSFVSGDVALAAWTLFIVPFLPQRWRWPVGALLVTYVVVVGFGRIAVGAHYLSDVVIAIILTLLVIALMSRLLTSAPGVAVIRWLAVLRDPGAR